MKSQIQISQLAESDISQATLWYSDKNKKLGLDYLNLLNSKFNQISINPLQFPVVHKEIRRALLQKYPYAIYFKIETDCILILAVLHTFRNPNILKKRT